MSRARSAYLGFASSLALAAALASACGDSPAPARPSGQGGAATSSSAGGSSSNGGATGARAPKVMIVNMSSIESVAFVSGLGLKDKIPVSGLTAAAPDVLCNSEDVCELTTGMGYGNAAASMTALVYRSGFDLTHTYFMIAGIAGVDPAQGTLGTAAWARFVVDVGYAYEIDAREMPSGWPYGYFGIGAATPADAPTNDDDAAVFQLDEDLLQDALKLSQSAKLTDDATAAGFRANYPTAPANAPPAVTQCDIVSSDTWFAGDVLVQRAHDFTDLLTSGAGVACMSAQEDNATLLVLARAAAAKSVDFARVAALRTASDFAAPYPGQSDADGLLGALAQGGLTPATQNLYAAAAPVIQAMVSSWSVWKSGAPKP